MYFKLFNFGENEDGRCSKTRVSQKTHGATHSLNCPPQNTSEQVELYMCDTIVKRKLRNLLNDFMSCPKISALLYLDQGQQIVVIHSLYSSVIFLVFDVCCFLEPKH